MTIYNEQCWKCACTTNEWDNGDGSHEYVYRGLCGDCGCTQESEPVSDDDEYDWYD